MGHIPELEHGYRKNSWPTEKPAQCQRETREQKLHDGITGQYRQARDGQEAGVGYSRSTELA